VSYPTHRFAATTRSPPHLSIKQLMKGSADMHFPPLPAHPSDSSPDSRSDSARPARIEPALLEAFEHQLTPDVARRLLELAARRTAMLRAAGLLVPADHAKLLVRDAISDTLTQVARWTPEEQPLGLHLRGIIRRRTWAKLSQLPAPRAASPAAPSPVVDTADQPPAPLAQEPGRARTVIQQVVAGLAYDSADDAAVRLVLEAYCNGASTGAEVSHAAGITIEEYAAARRRLDRLLAALPEPLEPPEPREPREPVASSVAPSLASIVSPWRAP
jgi:hypothetical protein